MFTNARTKMQTPHHSIAGAACKSPHNATENRRRNTELIEKKRQRQPPFIEPSVEWCTYSASKYSRRTSHSLTHTRARIAFGMGKTIMQYIALRKQHRSRLVLRARRMNLSRHDHLHKNDAHTNRRKLNRNKKKQTKKKTEEEGNSGGAHIKMHSLALSIDK